LNPGSIQVILRLAAFVWLLCFGLLAFIVWSIADELGIQIIVVNILLVLAIATAVLLYGGSLFSPQTKRVLPTVVVGFVASSIPFLIVFGFLGFAYFFLLPHAASVAWSKRDQQSYSNPKKNKTAQNKWKYTGICYADHLNEN
jgi:hypothetical protein